MYWSTKQFPEFRAMSDTEAKACMAFTFQKEPKIRILFWLVILLFFSGVFILGHNFSGFVENILFFIALTTLYYAYLIVSINYLYYPALKKHLNEYENTK